MQSHLVPAVRVVVGAFFCASPSVPCCISCRKHPLFRTSGVGSYVWFGFPNCQMEAYVQLASSLIFSFSLWKGEPITKHVLGAAICAEGALLVVVFRVVINAAPRRWPQVHS